MSYEPRDGSVDFGDTPNYLRSPAIIEGEIFWQVKWQSNNRILFDSYQSEIKLRNWNDEMFQELRANALQKL